MITFGLGSYQNDPHFTDEELRLSEVRRLGRVDSVGKGTEQRWELGCAEP